MKFKLPKGYCWSAEPRIIGSYLIHPGEQFGTSVRGKRIKGYCEAVINNNKLVVYKTPDWRSGTLKAEDLEGGYIQNDTTKKVYEVIKWKL